MDIIAAYREAGTYRGAAVIAGTRHADGLRPPCADARRRSRPTGPPCWSSGRPQSSPPLPHQPQ